MLQKVTRLDSVPTAEETVLTTEVPTKESRLYTLLHRSETMCIPNDVDTNRGHGIYPFNSFPIPFNHFLATLCPF